MNTSDLPQTFGSALMTFPDGTADHRSFVTAAMHATAEAFREGYAYKKAGVVITKLIAAADRTPSLFADTAAEDRDERLSAALDSLNAAYGRGIVRFGVQGDGKVLSAREHQSPHYTTRWEDLPKVKV